jgi:hypothetical protein
VLDSGITNSIPAGQTNQLALDIGFASATTCIEVDGGGLTIHGKILNGGTMVVSGTNTLKVSSISGGGNTTVVAGASLQVNSIHQHILSVGTGGRVVLGGVGSGAGTFDATTENDNATAFPTAIAAEASAEAASSAAMAATLASVAAVQSASSAMVGGNALAVPETVVATSLADAASSAELKMADAAAFVQMSAARVISKPVVGGYDSRPSIAANQAESAAPTASQELRGFAAIAVSDSQPIAPASDAPKSVPFARASTNVKQRLGRASQVALPSANLWPFHNSPAVPNQPTMALPEIAKNLDYDRLPYEESLLTRVLNPNNSTAATVNTTPATILANRAKAYDAVLEQRLLHSTLDDMGSLLDVINAHRKQRWHGSLPPLTSNADSVFATFDDGLLD